MTESTSTPTPIVATTELHCDTHGPSVSAYLCAHLLLQPVQTWHCNPPTAEEPCPDAWCDACERLFLQEGEWNEKNEGQVNIRLVCQHCYQDARAASVQAMDDEVKALWVDTVTVCHQALATRQGRLTEAYGLSTHERFDYDQASATLTFAACAPAPGRLDASERRYVRSSTSKYTCRGSTETMVVSGVTPLVT